MSQLLTSKLEVPSGSRRSASHKDPGAMLDVHSGRSGSDGHSEDGISSKKHSPLAMVEEDTNRDKIDSTATIILSQADKRN